VDGMVDAGKRLLARFAGSPLETIAGKVVVGERLSFEDGVAL